MTTAQAWLADQQNHLLGRIFAARVDAPPRGLATYRANAHASAERALLAAYPVIAQLVGSEGFAHLARDFWHQHPPQRGDLAQWGDALPPFLAASVQLIDTPYLADVARIEWALHICAQANDAAQDAASFALLTQHDPSALMLQLAPGTQVLPSPYPAAAITLAHMGEGTLDDAAALMHASVAQTALVWRRGFAPRVRVLHEAEHAFTTTLCQGCNLSQALDATPVDFDFSTWLAEQVQSGLVLGTVLSSQKKPKAL
jgi:Putative DNA-binding domain